jgi:hypothetical protein
MPITVSSWVGHVLLQIVIIYKWKEKIKSDPWMREHAMGKHDLFGAQVIGGRIHREPQSS